MSLISISIFVGLASALFGAMSNVLAKLVMGFANARDYIAVNFAIIFFLLIPFAPFYFSLESSLSAIGTVLAASMIDGLANYLYFKAFEINDSVTASIFLSLSPLFSLLLLPFLNLGSFGFSILDALGVVLIVMGIVILNWELQGKRHSSQRAKKRRFWGAPILASFLFGTNIYLIKFIFNQGFVNAYSYYFIRAFIIALLMIVALKPNLNWISPKRLGLATGRSSLVITQWMLMLSALQLGNPAIVKAASDTSPLFVILIAFLFLKEQISKSKILGAAIVIVGLIVLSI